MFLVIHVIVCNQLQQLGFASHFVEIENVYPSFVCDQCLFTWRLVRVKRQSQFVFSNSLRDCRCPTVVVNGKENRPVY